MDIPNRIKEMYLGSYLQGHIRRTSKNSKIKKLHCD